MLKGRALLVILKTSVVSGSIASPINLKATGVRFHRYQAIFVQVFGVWLISVPVLLDEFQVSARTNLLRHLNQIKRSSAEISVL